MKLKITILLLLISAQMYGAENNKTSGEAVQLARYEAIDAISLFIARDEFPEIEVKIEQGTIPVERVQKVASILNDDFNKSLAISFLINLKKMVGPDFTGAVGFSESDYLQDRAKLQRDFERSRHMLDAVTSSLKTGNLKELDCIKFDTELTGAFG